MFDKNSTKLFYVTKVVDASSTQYKKSTPLDILYENMDTHIHGEGAESNIERAVNQFLDAVGSDMESLKIRSIVKDSSFFNQSLLMFRRRNGDGSSLTSSSAYITIQVARYGIIELVRGAMYCFS